jgi:hypothetical protein
MLRMALHASGCMLYSHGLSGSSGTQRRMRSGSWPRPPTYPFPKSTIGLSERVSSVSDVPSWNTASPKPTPVSPHPQISAKNAQAVRCSLRSSCVSTALSVVQCGAASRRQWRWPHRCLSREPRPVDYRKRNKVRRVAAPSSSGKPEPCAEMSIAMRGTAAVSMDASARLNLCRASCALPS